MSSYAECISEVFIKPIRSVLAIDDEFPTLDRLITQNVTGDANSTHWVRLRKFLEYCRNKNPHWLVDVDDGQSLQGDFPPVGSMRQCHWLILDYKLQGHDGDGSRAVSILRSLAASEHFNLVLIYTDQPLAAVFQHVVVALSDIPKKIAMSPEEQRELGTLLDSWADSDPDIESKLRKAVSLSVCFELLQAKDLLAENPLTWSILGGLSQLVEAGGADVKGLRQLLLRQCLAWTTESLFKSGFEGFKVGFAPSSANKRWLAAGNIFVAIEQKSTEADSLLENMRAALEEWAPSPNQLIIAKLRAEFESRGFVLEESITRDKHLQAFWLDLLANSEPQEEAHHIGVFVDRETELLADHLKPKVAEFAVRMMADVKARMPSSQIANTYFEVNIADPDIRKAARISHNTHVSTKPRSGKNLSPGHILRFNDKGSDGFWVCLSPACDLEAGREGGRAFKQRVRPWMPFTIVKLHPIENALKYATHGWVVFLEVDGAKMQFSYFPDKNDTKGPEWEECFALNEGRLGDDFRLEIARTHLDDDGSALVLQTTKAEVIGQLRGEYAISLTQRLTGHLARIGLEYEGR